MLLEACVYLLLTATVLFVSAHYMKRVSVVSFWKALLVALAIGVLNFFVGWLLTLILNMMSLGIFYFLGLGFITRTIAFAIVIEIVDHKVKGFETKGFIPSLILAVFIALASFIVDLIFFGAA